MGLTHQKGCILAPSPKHTQASTCCHPFPPSLVAWPMKPGVPSAPQHIPVLAFLCPPHPPPPVWQSPPPLAIEGQLPSPGTPSGGGGAWRGGEEPERGCLVGGTPLPEMLCACPCSHWRAGAKVGGGGITTAVPLLPVATGNTTAAHAPSPLPPHCFSMNQPLHTQNGSNSGAPTARVGGGGRLPPVWGGRDGYGRVSCPGWGGVGRFLGGGQYCTCRGHYLLPSSPEGLVCPPTHGAVGISQRPLLGEGSPVYCPPPLAFREKYPASRRHHTPHPTSQLGRG